MFSDEMDNDCYSGLLPVEGKERLGIVESVTLYFYCLSLPKAFSVDLQRHLVHTILQTLVL